MKAEVLFCRYFFCRLPQCNFFEDILFCLRQQMIIHRCRGCGGRSRSRKQQIADMIADIPLFA
jgi:hypothetical protein